MDKQVKKSNRGGSPEEQKLRAAQTRSTLLQVARRLFAHSGYYSTGTTELVAEAAVTRGALYHHFSDKEQLFEAVYREVSAELNQRARKSALTQGAEVWTRFVQGLTIYLEMVAASAEARQILLIDGPAVLGGRRWRELQSEWVAAGVAHSLEVLMERGIVAPGDAGSLALLIQAAVNDAALAIAYAADPKNESRRLTAALVRFLDGLRVPAWPSKGSALDIEHQC